MLTLAMAKARRFLLRCGALHRASYSHSSGGAFPQALRYVLELLSGCASEAWVSHSGILAP